MMNRPPLTIALRLAAASVFCLLLAASAAAQCTTATTPVSGQFAGGGAGSAPMTQSMTATGAVSGGNLVVTVTYDIMPNAGAGTVTQLQVVFGAGFTGTVNTSTSGNNISYSGGTYAPSPYVQIPTFGLGGGAMRAQGTVTIPLNGTSVTNGSLTLVPFINGSFQPNFGGAARFNVLNNTFAVPTSGEATEGNCVTGIQPTCQTLDSASISASTINQGDSVTFTVNTTNASGVTLTDLSTGQVINFSGNTLTVSPTASTTYRVTVNGACAPVMQDFGVTVNQPPNIWVFWVNPNPICAGATTTLGWDTGGASAVSVTDLATGEVTTNLGSSGTLDVTPPTNRSYRLTASNGAGSDSREVSVTVNPLPAINSFSASPGSIFQGQSTRLNFSSSNSTSQTITDLATGQVIDVTGLPFLDVAPSSTRTYRYTAAGSCAPTSQDVGVTVTPVTGNISASPNPIVVCDGTGLGQTTISWSANVGQVQIRVGAPNGDVLANGGASGTAPTGTWVSNGMVFYLQNAEFGDPASAANTIATVTVGVTTAGCPAILSFSSNVGAVCPGGGAVLSYSTQNATSGNINGTPLPSLPSGTMTVFPTAPFSDYVLTINGGPGGADTRTQTLRVNVNPTASADGLTATPNPISAGQSTRLNFSSSNSTSQTITDLATNQVFNVTGQSFFDVTPPSTRTYRYTASGACGSDSRDIQVTVNACQTGNMTASATTINQGQNVIFTTTASNATSASVTDLLTGQVISVNVPSGTATFTPSSTRTFRFTVNGACGPFTQDIQVTVNPTPVIVSYGSSAPSVCAGGSVVLSYNTQNVTSGNINGTPLPTLPSGTMTVFPTAPGSSYVLTVNGAGGQTASQTLSVSVTPNTAITSFTPSASTITLGQSVTFTTGASNASSGTVTDLTSGQVINVAVPNGTATFTPAAAGTRTFRFTANGTCNSPTQDVQITVNPAVTGNVLIGPVGFPGAVGPTSNNDDYTNLTISGAAAVPTNGRNSAAQTLTFINTLRNNATAADNITLSLQFVPNAAFSNSYQISVNGGASYQVFNGDNPVTISVPAQSNLNVLLRVTVPANQFILSGFSTVLRATSGITPSVWNETIDRAWTGFISVSKSQTVTNSTGVGGATAPVRGAVIRYSAAYTNVTAASGTGNADLTASNLILTEDGAAAPNNWASTTNHVAGSATVTTAGATVTGDVAGSSVLTATIPTLAPGATGTFSFSRTIK